MLQVEGCQCYKCLKKDAEEREMKGAEFLDLYFGQHPLSRMILCQKCGNKRCPHAADHDLACTESNEPGQKGSLYE